MASGGTKYLEPLDFGIAISVFSFREYSVLSLNSSLEQISWKLDRTNPGT
jgi:hypothetical protein